MLTTIFVFLSMDKNTLEIARPCPRDHYMTKISILALVL